MYRQARMIHTGRHFLQIPGPTNVPDRVLRAMDRPVIDHRGPEFPPLLAEVREGLGRILKTAAPVVVFPGSGTGAWEAAIVNTLCAGDRVLMFETGHFSHLWRQVAQRFGIEVDYVAGSWRRGASVSELYERLRNDSRHSIQAVMVVHNETSTGVCSDVAGIRQVINRLSHPALLMVDSISSLASMDFRHDEWEVDVTVAASQKGLMLPPGLCINAVSAKALAAGKRATLPRSYWDWQPMLAPGTFAYPYTPATNLLFGLREAIQMLEEEGLPNVFSRHQRLAHATRAAVKAWGLDIVCEDPHEYSNSVTAVLLPDGSDADHLRALILEHFDLSLGAGLSKLAGRAFRIGHLGHLNELTLAGTLSGVEMGLRLAGIPHRPGGILAALNELSAVREAASASAKK
jgi:alanine-glyoxylate transaminase/serine-glyoxylate transaminase/serine-pyruvate transaminase